MYNVARYSQQSTSNSTISLRVGNEVNRVSNTGASTSTSEPKNEYPGNSSESEQMVM